MINNPASWVALALTAMMAVVALRLNYKYYNLVLWAVAIAGFGVFSILLDAIVPGVVSFALATLTCVAGLIRATTPGRHMRRFRKDLDEL